MGIKTQEKAKIVGSFTSFTLHVNFALHTYWRVFLCKYGLRTFIGRWGAPTGLAAPGARHPRYAGGKS
jgi:hypothetical protein